MKLHVILIEQDDQNFSPAEHKILYKCTMQDQTHLCCKALYLNGAYYCNKTVLCNEGNKVFNIEPNENYRHKISQYKG